MENRIIEIELNNAFSKIRTPLEPEVRTAIYESLAYEIPGAQFSPLFQQGHWDGKKHLFTQKMQVLPTGLLGQAVQILKAYDYEVQWIDSRNQIEKGIEIPIVGIELRDYQKEAVDIALKSIRGVVQLATGGGKTEIFASIIGKLNVLTTVFTHTATLLHQTKKRLESRLRVPIGLIGDGQCDIHRVNVATMQTIKNERFFNLLENSQCIIYDEAHHVPANTMWDLHKKCTNAYWRFGFSATPWREDGSELLLHGAVGKIIYRKSASDLIRDGWLSKPNIYMIKVPRIPGIEGWGYHQIYEAAIEKSSFRNNLIVDLCHIMYGKKRTVLVAVNKIDHGHILLSMVAQKYPHIKAVFIRGEIDTKERDATLTALNNKEIDLVFATTVFGEGIDCPTLDCLINAKGGESSIDSIQLIGRALRKPPGKLRATVFDFQDSSRYFLKHANSRLWAYQTEPEFDISIIKPEQIFGDTIR